MTDMRKALDVRQWAAGLALLILVAVTLPSVRPQIANVYENAMFALAPSAERAFEYGERHFNAKNPGFYDIDRARYFFQQAALRDPSLPYLFHELARVSFLRGDYDTALARIDFQISMHGDEAPNSYYVRGLIEGYMGKYDDAARDYAYYISLEESPSWASLNDYAWVLLKSERFQEALETTARGLEHFPDNPWLLNSHATALFELKEYQEALKAAQKASVAVATITEDRWLRAYPGNDPKIAKDGIQAFKEAIKQNIHTIKSALSSNAVQ